MENIIWTLHNEPQRNSLGCVSFVSSGFCTAHGCGTDVKRQCTGLYVCMHLCVCVCVCVYVCTCIYSDITTTLLFFTLKCLIVFGLLTTSRLDSSSPPTTLDLANVPLPMPSGRKPPAQAIAEQKRARSHEPEPNVERGELSLWVVSLFLCADPKFRIPDIDELEENLNELIDSKSGSCYFFAFKVAANYLDYTFCFTLMCWWCFDIEESSNDDSFLDEMVNWWDLFVWF